MREGALQHDKEKRNDVDPYTVLYVCADPTTLANHVLVFNLQKHMFNLLT